MRITLSTLPPALFLLLPFVVACNGWGVIKTTLVFILVLLVRQAVLFYTIYVKKQADDLNTGRGHKYVLESLTISQYVEKVRWSMEYCGIPFVEEEDVGIVGGFLFGRRVPTLHVPLKNISISNSSDILRYLYGVEGTTCSKTRKFLKADENAMELERKFDLLSEALRRCIYQIAFSLSESQRLNFLHKAWGLHQSSVPEWQKLLLKAMQPLLIGFVARYMSLTEEDKELAKEEVRQGFKEIDEIFSDGRQFLQGGTEPTYLDFALASMFGHIFLPDNLGGNVFDDKSKITMEDTSPEALEVKNELKETLTGKFVIRMYKEHRMERIAKKNKLNKSGSMWDE